MNEFERIAAIRERLARTRSDVLVGIGDDAAVLAPSPGKQVLTVDVAVEGRHFRRELMPWRDVGYRAFVAAASDLAAMGAEPRAALLALVLPDTVNDGALFAIVDGVAEAADAIGAIVVGGNLSGGSELSITTTVTGELDGEPLTRAGARPGDGLYLNGPVGDAALGLALLEAGRTDDPDPRVQHFVTRYRRPTAALMTGRRLVGQATAAIDLSDGLLADLGHLCEASRTGAEIHWEALPLSTGFAELCAELDLSPTDLALAGGDDYRLLFAAPASSAAKSLGTRIGSVTEAPTLRVHDADGRELKPPHPGWQHF